MRLLDPHPTRSTVFARWLRDRTTEAAEAVETNLDRVGLLDGRTLDRLAESDGGADVLAYLSDGTVLWLEPYTGAVEVLG
jgi:hypothetical protein